MIVLNKTFHKVGVFFLMKRTSNNEKISNFNPQLKSEKTLY